MVNNLTILPMTKTSTIHFTVNDLASKSKPMVEDVDSAFDFESQYSDVFDALDEISYDVCQEVVDEILYLASQM
jgi:hypothetical protein